MGGCVAVWLVVLAAIVHLPSGTAQFQTCHDNAAANCGGNVVTGVSTARECCLGDGFWFMVWGQCVQCIVHGFERTVVLVDEGNVQETLVISLDIKGTTTDELPQNRVNQFDLTAICRDVTTERDDYGTTACGSRVELDVNNPAALTSQVLITFPADNNALEGTEELRLELQLPPVTQAAVNFAGNVFFQDVSIQIRDTTVLRSGFGQEVYSGNEGPDRRSTLPNAPCRVTIRLQDTTIEAPLTFRLSPRTPSEIFAANGPWPSPCTAAFKGANASRMDFNTRPFDVTMAAGTEAVLAEIAIVDDEINEAEEYFVVVLEIITSTTNPVEFTIQTAVCRIPRTDPIQIGFTQSRVEHNESQATFEAVLEKDRPSDQTFVIRIRISTPRIQGAGEPATAFPSSPADFGLGNTTVRTVRLTPADNVAVLAYQIFEDNTPEETEMFQLSADPDPDTRDNPDFKCDADAEFQFHGRDCFTDLQVLILDDDVVVVGFVETLVEVDESDGQATLKVSISFPAPNPTLSFVIMFRLDATMTSITAGPRPASSGRFDPVIPGIHDYQEILPAVILPREFEDTRRLQTFNVQIFEDGVPEDVEELNITLSLQDPRLANWVIVRPAVATVRIRDNDRIVVGFERTTYAVNDADGQVELCVIVIQPADQNIGDVTFNLTVETQDGTAMGSGIDYVSVMTILPTFTTQQPRQCFNVAIIDDAEVKKTEHFFATLTLIPASVTTIDPNRITVDPVQVTVNIMNDDLPPVVGFHPTLYTVAESEGAVVMFRIVKLTTTTQSVSVLLSTSPSTATAANDFIGRTGVIMTFAPSETNQIVSVTVVNDNTLEKTEEFTAVLTMAISGRTVVLGTATATITDDDSVVIQFDPVMYTVTEGGSTMLRIVRVGNADIPVSATISTRVGTADLVDFTAIISQIVTFQPGNPEQFVPFTTSADTTVEDTEMLTAVLSNPSTGATLGQDTANICVTNVDAVVVEFDPTSYTVTESEGAVVMFRIMTCTNTTRPVSVLFSTSPDTATDPADFTGQTKVTVTFAPEQNVSVSVVNDDTVESTETFTAMLTAIPGSMVMIGAADTATATIIDDDRVKVTFDPTEYIVNENEGTVTVIVRKIGQSTIPVTVYISTSDGSATAGKDFMGIVIQTLTFPTGGDDVIEVSIPLINDTIDEPTEDFSSALFTSDPSVVILENVATVYIIDDDLVVTSPEYTTVPPESNSVGPIAGAVVAVGIISFSIIIIVIIVSRRPRARFDLRKEESQGAAAMSGGASEVKFKEDIPMAECTAYGTLGTHQTSGEYSFIQSFPGGVSEGQQGVEGENEAVEGVYEPIPN